MRSTKHTLLYVSFLPNTIFQYHLHFVMLVIENAINTSNGNNSILSFFGMIIMFSFVIEEYEDVLKVEDIFEHYFLSPINIQRRSQRRHFDERPFTFVKDDKQLKNKHIALQNDKLVYSCRNSSEFV